MKKQLLAMQVVLVVLVAAVVSDCFRPIVPSGEPATPGGSGWLTGSLDEALKDEKQARLFGRLLNYIDFPSLDLSNLGDKLSLSRKGQLGQEEVVIRDEAGNPKVARVFISLGFQPLDELGVVGNWVYFVKGETGVTMIDAGSRYKLMDLLHYGVDAKDVAQALKSAESGSGLDMNSLMSLVHATKRCQSAAPINDNLTYMMDAVQKYFPNDKVIQIILTHWHWDHTENAPFVQEELTRRQGLKPVLRINAPDKKYPDADGSLFGAEKVFTDACAASDSWLWGDDVRDGEELDGSGLKVVYTPGHTFGFISFVSDQDKYAITGPSILSCKDQEPKEADASTSALKSIAGESPKYGPISCTKFWGLVGAEYKLLSLHPDVGFGGNGSEGKSGSSSGTNSGKAMIGATVSEIAKSAWAKSHRYGDCGDQNPTGMWPRTIASLVDCTLPDALNGPSDQDKQVAPEPAGLYYKHLTPGDMYASISLKSYADIVRSLKPADGKNGTINLRALMNAFYPIVEEDPVRFAKVSIDSFMVGIEGDSNDPDSLVKSVSLMVHPGYERPISTAIGIDKRVENLYQPFVEEAIGGKVDIAQLQGLYEAALNRCGGKATNGDQGGLGKKMEAGNFVISVQLWPTGDTTGDCNIHVVAK